MQIESRLKLHCSGDRTVILARAGETEPVEVYLVERLNPAEVAPKHPSLLTVETVITYEEKPYWLIRRPVGAPWAAAPSGRKADSATAIHLVRELGGALLCLAPVGMLPGDFYSFIHWSGERLLLDYPGALLVCAKLASTLRGIEEIPGPVVTLAALLHSLITGKPATEPPYVFLPLSQIEPGASGGLERVVAEGLDGALTLEDFLRRLAQVESYQRLVHLFPPPVQHGATPAPPPIAAGNRTRVATDLLIWAACLAVGLLVLFKYA